MTRLFTILLALFALLVAAKSDDKLPKLQIGITKKASDCKAKSKSGDNVAIHYTGKLADGTKFDSSYDRSAPLEFPLGVGRVVKGFDSGALNMCLGEKRKLKIPPHLGYGKQGAGGVIPPDATLVFEIEMVGINGKTLKEEESEDEEAPDLVSDHGTDDESEDDDERDL